MAANIVQLSRTSASPSLSLCVHKRTNPSLVTPLKGRQRLSTICSKTDGFNCAPSFRLMGTSVVNFISSCLSDGWQPPIIHYGTIAQVLTNHKMQDWVTLPNDIALPSLLRHRNHNAIGNVEEPHGNQHVDQMIVILAIGRAAGARTRTCGCARADCDHVVSSASTPSTICGSASPAGPAS